MRGLVFAAWRFAAGLARPSGEANARRLRAQGESPASFTIRDATAADIPALARVHVAAWNATHGPLLVRGPDVALRERQWREAFARHDAAPDPAWCCLLVERSDGARVGFAEGRRSDNPDYDGELRKIFLLPESQRLGLGRRLVGHVARRFLRLGMTSMWLTGDARNPSRGAWL